MSLTLEVNSQAPAVLDNYNIVGSDLKCIEDEMAGKKWQKKVSEYISWMFDHEVTNKDIVKWTKQYLRNVWAEKFFVLTSFSQNGSQS